MKHNKKIRNIQEQIMSGYFKMVIVIILLAISISICLFWIRTSYLSSAYYQNNRTEIQTAIAGHYSWLENLNMSIQSDEEFSGGKDATSCSLGKWMAIVNDNEDKSLMQDLSIIAKPHENIHNSVEGILEESKVNKEEAYQVYMDELVPQTKLVIDYLEKMNVEYSNDSDHSSDMLIAAIMTTIGIVILFVVGAVAFAFLYANKSSHKISDSLVIITEWADKLSLGFDDLSFDAINEDGNQLKEINSLVNAFKIMASNIRDNVNVLEHVADGDMSTFVNIRSPKDSLGKNLYRMVQSNDLLFKNIREIAQSVTESSKDIGKISEILIDNVTTQENAIVSLSEAMETSSILIENTNKKSHAAIEITDRLLKIAIQSNEKMDELVDSVNDISAASEQISTVIKAIDNIAFQTNILSLNAAVESARAGEAGKGFAVVADEVRNLANKSALAAEESTLLIKDSIEKANDGSKNARETSEIFHSIIEEINAIVAIIRDVALSSEEQIKAVHLVNGELCQIAEATEHNSTISGQSENASEEMRKYAEMLYQEMSNFNLRKRQDGNPYIPEEKKNDADYIKHATFAYQTLQESGKYGNEYITPKR